MADEVKIRPIEGALDAYTDIAARLRDITTHNDQQLAQMKALNVQASIMNKATELHLSDEQRLLTLQTSIAAKSNEIASLTEQITNLRNVGGAMEISQAAALEATQHRINANLIEENRLYGRLATQIAAQNTLLNIANKTGFQEMLKLSNELRSSWASHPILGLGILLTIAVEVFNKLDSAAAEFRMQMGFTRQYTKTIDDNAREIAFNFAHIGVTAKTVYEATTGISKGLFSSMSATKDMVSDVSIIAAQLGISAEESTQFMKSMGIASKSTADAQRDMVFFAQSMSDAAGVPLKEIMGDISKATASSYQYLTRSGKQLIQSAIEAKRMGTSLSSAAESSKNLLSFTSSVNKEMEASVLVGKAINLQHARELSYRRDLKGLNQEILKIMRETNFENLDPFQQEAVAQALGKSAGELANMAQAERERLGWESSSDEIVRAQLKSYKEMQAATESTAKTLAKDQRYQLMIKQNQSAITAITQSWGAILQRIGQAVLPIVEVTLRGIAYLVGWINTGVTKWNALWEKAGHTMGMVGKYIASAATAALLLVGVRGLGRLVGWASGGVGRSIGTMLGGVARGVGRFGAANVLRGALGIAAVGASLWVFAKSISAFAGVKWPAVWVGLGALAAFATVAAIIGSPAVIEWVLLGALGIAALGAALIPFAAAAWIFSKAIQNLSDIPYVKVASGLFCLGQTTPFIVAAGLGMALAAPGFITFGMALRLAIGPIERASKAMSSLGSGLTQTASALKEMKDLSFIGTIREVRGLGNAIVELSKAINEIPDIKIDKLKSLILPEAAAETGQKKGESTNDMLAAIKDSIEGLRTDMKNGVLTADVYLDSQKLESGMSRRLAFTGALT